MNRRQAAQTLVAFALLFPLVLLPVGAYAVQATLLASRASLLQSATASAAEDASRAVDAGVLRATGILRLDPLAVSRIARSALVDQDPAAVLDDGAVRALAVTVRAHDQVPLGFGGILGTRSARLAATATAHLAAGYLRPGN